MPNLLKTRDQNTQISQVQIYKKRGGVLIQQQISGAYFTILISKKNGVGGGGRLCRMLALLAFVGRFLFWKLKNTKKRFF